MSTRVPKRLNKANINRSEDFGSAEMSFDVVEWLDGERLEHERRMQELGYPCESKEEFSKPSERQSRRKSTMM